jgi:hypothetical protein
LIPLGEWEALFSVKGRREILIKMVLPRVMTSWFKFASLTITAMALSLTGIHVNSRMR